MFSGGGGKVPLIWLAGGKTRRYKNHYGGFPQFLILYLRVLPPACGGQSIKGTEDREGNMSKSPAENRALQRRREKKGFQL